MLLDDWSSPRASYSSPRTSTKARLLPLSLNDDHYQPKLDAPPIMLPDSDPESDMVLSAILDEVVEKEFQENTKDLR